MNPKPSRARLMILDNDRGLVDLAAWYLERQGYVVDKATSFREARHLLATDPPDLLLSDVEMGAESGADELPRLSAEGLLPPTLVVSGFLDAQLADSLLALPQVLGTLVKPFDLPELERRLEGCLARIPAARPRAARPATPGSAAQAQPVRSPALDAADPRGVVEGPDGWIEVRALESSADRRPAEGLGPPSWRG